MQQNSSVQPAQGPARRNVSPSAVIGSSGVAPADAESTTSYVLLASGPAINDGRHQEDPSRSITFLASVQRARKINIRLCMYYAFFGTLVFSIIQWNIFDAYLALLAKELNMKYINSSVGFAESIVGLTSLCMAVPIGMIVDAYSRTKTMKWAALLGLVASSISFYAFYYDSIVPLYGNLFLWGLYNETTCSASEAIFADSIPTGERSTYFAQKGFLERISLATGPVIMLCLFWYFGDNWTLQGMHVPLLLGCACAPIPCLLCCFFRNPHPEVSFPDSPASPSGPGSVRQQLMVASPTTRREQLTCASPVMSLAEEVPEDNGFASAEEQRFANMTKAEKCIPWLVMSSDLIRRIGAGMTVKFFPLFFIRDYAFSPVEINILFAVYPVFMASCAMLQSSVASKMGRAHAGILFQFTGIAFLIGMCHVSNVWIMIVFFILRGSFQNAGYPIDKSIIMDYVPSHRRGLWNAIEQITSVTWSGSAVLGGILADVRDYRYTFMITACIYVFAGLVYAPLLWLVPRNESDLKSVSKKNKVRSKIVPECPTANQPFLEEESPASTDADEGPTMVIYSSDGESPFVMDELSHQHHGHHNSSGGHH